MHVHNFISRCMFQFDETPLGVASYYGHTSVVAYLLESGAHVNAIDKVSRDM